MMKKLEGGNEKQMKSGEWGGYNNANKNEFIYVGVDRTNKKRRGGIQ